jgi:predicted transcriptional regulator YheO
MVSPISNNLFEQSLLLKGSVSEVASQLKVSEATTYRYLNKIKKEQ